MPNYAGQRPDPAYRLTVSALRGKLFVFGGVGSDGGLALLDTGYTAASESDKRAANRLR